jgi:hypothetical protein
MNIGDVVRANQYAQWAVRQAKTGIIIGWHHGIVGMAAVLMSDSVTRPVLTRYLEVISETR